MHRLSVLLLLFFSSSALSSGPKLGGQAHLPLAPGLPPLPDLPINSGVKYVGAPLVEYHPGNIPQASIGGSPISSLTGALGDVPYANPQFFHEWDVNRASGPSLFDCPEGFALNSENLCIFSEYRRAEESCPYGTFRAGKGGSGGCVQVDSVPPDRTCPSGFHYFMRGCIRRTQIPPILTCGPGYTQIEDTCFSLSSIKPLITCPDGFSLTEEKALHKTIHICSKEFVMEPAYVCSEGSHLHTEDDEEHPTTRPKCIRTRERELVRICPQGFQLGLPNEVIMTENMSEMSQATHDPDQLRCVRTAEYPGSFNCPVGYELTVTHELSSPMKCKPSFLTSSPFLAPSYSLNSLREKWDKQKQVTDGSAQMSTHPDGLKKKMTVFTDYSRGLHENPAVRGVAVAKSASDRVVVEKLLNEKNYHQSLKKSKERQQRRLNEEPPLVSALMVDPLIKFERGSCLYLTMLTNKNSSPLGGSSIVWKPGGPGDRAPYLPFCREVQIVPPKLDCPINTRVQCARKLSKSKRSKEFTKEDPTASKRLLKGSKTQTAEACLQDRTFSRCDEYQAMDVAQPTCPEEFGDGIASEHWSLNNAGLCVRTDKTPPIIECPFGVGSVEKDSDRCDVLIAQPIDAACPEGYTRGSQDIASPGNQFFTKMTKRGLPLLPPATGGTNGVCELVEYADYQITCPAGYQRERARNTVFACLAEKHIPPTVICPPGFVLSPSAPNPLTPCQKTVQVAPTVISYPFQDQTGGFSGHHDGPVATACILTKENKLSCGVEKKYHGAVNLNHQIKLGEAYKAKTDAKNRKHTDKYSSSSG